MYFMLDFDTAKIYTNYFPHNNINQISEELLLLKHKTMTSPLMG